MTGAPLPELAGLAEAEEFFEALGVRYQARVLAAHRLQVLRVFRLAVESWDAAHPSAGEAARRAAVARALQAAHEVYAAAPARDDAPGPVFGQRLVRLGRR